MDFVLKSSLIIGLLLWMPLYAINDNNPHLDCANLLNRPIDEKKSFDNFLVDFFTDSPRVRGLLETDQSLKRGTAYWAEFLKRLTLVDLALDFKIPGTNKAFRKSAVKSRMLLRALFESRLFNVYLASDGYTYFQPLDESSKVNKIISEAIQRTVNFKESVPIQDVHSKPSFKIDAQYFFPTTNLNDKVYISRKNFTPIQLVDNFGKKFIVKENKSLHWNPTTIDSRKEHWSRFISNVQINHELMISGKTATERPTLIDVTLWGLSIPKYRSFLRPVLQDVSIFGLKGTNLEWLGARWRSVQAYMLEMPDSVFEGTIEASMADEDHDGYAIIAMSNFQRLNAKKVQNPPLVKIRQVQIYNVNFSESVFIASEWTNSNLFDVDLSKTKLDRSQFNNILFGDKRGIKGGFGLAGAKNSLRNSSCKDCNWNGVQFQGWTDATGMDARGSLFHSKTDLRKLILNATEDGKTMLDGATYDDSVELPESIIGIDSEELKKKNEIDRILQQEFGMIYRGKDKSRKFNSREMGNE